MPKKPKWRKLGVESYATYEAGVKCQTCDKTRKHVVRISKLASRVWLCRACLGKIVEVTK